MIGSGCRGDRGQVTVLMMPIIVALLAVAGLVIDGGAALAARQQAANLAEQAARLGADQLDQASLRGAGPATVDVAAATAAARGYLAAQGQAGRVDVNMSAVRVTVTISRRASLLQLVGIKTLTVTAHAAARSVGGISTVEDP
jgi:Flp pilus assembly protein TadG